MRSKPVNVLIVEDEEEIRKLNKKSVEKCSDDKYHYLTEMAEDGLEAYEKMEDKEKHFHIILLDITLDKSSKIDDGSLDRVPYQEHGLRFLEKIRDYHQTPKVIIYTRHTEISRETHDYLIDAMNLHSFGIISKKDPPQKQDETLKKLLREAADELLEMPPDIEAVFEGSDD